MSLAYSIIQDEKPIYDIAGNNLNDMLKYQLGLEDFKKPNRCRLCNKISNSTHKRCEQLEELAKKTKEILLDLEFNIFCLKSI